MQRINVNESPAQKKIIPLSIDDAVIRGGTGYEDIRRYRKMLSSLERFDKQHGI